MTQSFLKKVVANKFTCRWFDGQPELRSAGSDRPATSLGAQASWRVTSFLPLFFSFFWSVPSTRYSTRELRRLFSPIYFFVFSHRAHMIQDGGGADDDAAVRDGADHTAKRLCARGWGPGCRRPDAAHRRALRPRPQHVRQLRHHFDHFSRSSQPHATSHAPCYML